MRADQSKGAFFSDAAGFVGESRAGGTMLLEVLGFVGESKAGGAMFLEVSGFVGESRAGESIWSGCFEALRVLGFLVIAILN